MQGGLTYGQVIGLYESRVQEDLIKMKFMAAIHGAKLGGGATVKSEDNYMFRDPKDYETMSEEEKEKLTSKMMGHFKSWAKQAL